MKPGYATTLGAWAVVAGASEGLGAAFATALAQGGMSLVLVARRAAPLQALADELRATGVEVRTLALDLAAPAAIDTLVRATALLEVGLVIYNAAFAPVGPLVMQTPEDLQRVVDVNVRAPLAIVRAFAPPMVARRRGALVLMSSLAGLQGGPRIATYAASKAFTAILAEGLWHELRAANVHVLASCAGAIRTPGYAGASRREAPGILDAETVARETLAAIGRGPRVIPGLFNRVAAWCISRVLPRRWTIAIMASNTEDLSP